LLIFLFENKKKKKKKGGGFYHNHDFGFGRIDAFKLVSAAKTWVNVPANAPTFSTPRVVVSKTVLSTWVNGTTVVANSGIDFVEHVDVIFQYTSTQGRRGNVEVVARSPYGTESVLATPHGDSLSSYPPEGWKFGTVRNWGEAADGILFWFCGLFCFERMAGTWTVSCKDASGAPGTFTFFQLNIYGFKKAH
jgi:subtilisin-like proprotein convertase family protein